MTLIDAFEYQATSCERMGSPFMGRLLRILGAHWDETTALGQAMAAYSGDVGPAGHSLPLRIAGGLHALVLTQQDAALVGLYPPSNASDTELEDATRNALITHEDFLLAWTQSPPQTNEVRRSAALIAMAHVARSYFDRPVVLSELGASGGLNLGWDQFALDAGGQRFGPYDAVLTLTPTWDGALPPMDRPHVVSRAGVDLNPLDVHSTEGALRLTAYLWPDQPERLANTRRAAQALRAKIEKGDAIEWLERRLSTTPDGHMHLIQHTVAWQYFPKEAQARGLAMIEAAGARATAETPLGWMQMETDGDATGAIGAALTLRLWPGDVTLNLGRADFHGRWINWTG